MQKQQQQMKGEEEQDKGTMVLLSDEDKDLLNNLPHRQLTLSTSLSEPNRTPEKHPKNSGGMERDIESGESRPTQIRSASFSGQTTKASTMVENFMSYMKIPLLAPQLSRQPSVPVFYCKICLENQPVSNSFVSAYCSYPHVFCRESVKAFVESVINEGVVKIRCPGFGECEAFLSDDEIQDLCEESTWTKFQRFRELKENPNFRECPFCNHSTIANELNPEITCEQCGQKYCFFHANAHPNMLCHQYTKEQLKSQMQSYMFIKSNTRNCPSCTTPTEKNGGCNHMTCQHCQANWCWLCGNLMESNHFDDPINGCLGGQFIDPPPFALWTICPWCRSAYLSFITRIPAHILVIIALLVAGSTCLVGVILTICFLPLTFPLTFLLRMESLPCQITSSLQENIILSPGILICGLVGLLYFLILELIWLPIPLLLSTCFFPLFLLSRDTGPDGPSTLSYFRCVQGDNLDGFWCYPLQATLNGIVGVIQFFERSD